MPSGEVEVEVEQRPTTRRMNDCPQPRRPRLCRFQFNRDRSPAGCRGPDPANFYKIVCPRGNDLPKQRKRYRIMTPLNLRRSLLLHFPELIEVRYKKSKTGLIFYYKILSGSIDNDRLIMWENVFKPAGMVFEYIGILTYTEDIEDIEEKLLEIPASISLIEDTIPNELAASITLRKVFGDVIENLGSSVSYAAEVYWASFMIWLSELPGEILKKQIECVLNGIFMHEFTVRYMLGAGIYRKTSTNVWSEKQAEDLALLHDNIEAILQGADLPITLAPLLEKSATFTSTADGIGSIKRLSTIFDTIYTEVPVKLDYFRTAFGVDINEYINALELGRIIPVFTQKLENYEQSIVDNILNADVKRLILPGELQLRMLAMICRIHPIVAFMESMDDEFRAVQSLINSASEVRLEWLIMKKYAEIIAKWLTKVRLAAKDLTPLGITNTPLALGVEEILRMLVPNMPERFTEFGAVFHFSILNKCLGGTTVSVAGHFLEKYYDAVNCVGFVGSSIERINPTMLGAILIGENDMKLSDFLEDFDGPAIARMRMLMSSPRLISKTDLNIAATFSEFNKEAREFNKPGSIETAVEVASIAKDVFIDGPAGFVISPISNFVLSKAEKIAPLFADKLSAKLKRTTQEGVALAKIRRTMGY